MTFVIDDDFEDYMRRTHVSVEQHSSQWETMRITWFGATAVFMKHMMEMTQEDDQLGISVLDGILKQLEEFHKLYKKEHDLE